MVLVPTSNGALKSFADKEGSLGRKYITKRIICEKEDNRKENLSGFQLSQIGKGFCF